MRPLAGLVLPVLLVVSVLCVPASAYAADEPAAKPSAPSVADMAWVAGHWVGQMEGSLSEEVWTAPAGGAMIGMWRLVQGDQARIYELLAFETGADGKAVLKLRHFRPGLIALEDKESPYTFQLADWKEGEATFLDNHDPAKPTRLTYRRTGEDAMTVVLERTRDGKTQADEFKYTRKK